MGDRLNNNRVPHQRSQAAASFGSNNVSGRSDITLADARPRPPAGPLASAQKSETASLTAFLQAFPSLEEVYRKFPEFENLTLPDTIDDKTVESFERLLESVLEPARYNGLTNSHAPADILRGLSELRTRQDGGKAVPARHGRSEAADRPPEDKRDAGRLRRPRATLPNYLMNRETGSRPHPGDGLPPRFAAVRQDRLASTAIAMNCDSKVLQHRYKGPINRSFKLVRKNHAEHERIILKNKNSITERIDYKSTFPAEYIEIPINIEQKTSDFFSNLFRHECTLRFLHEAEGPRFLLEDPEGDETVLAEEVAEKRLATLLKGIVAQTSREIVAGLLIFEQARHEFKDRSPFEKTLIASLAVFYQKGDFSEAKAAFKSGLKTLFLEMPGAGRRESMKLFEAADKYSQAVYDWTFEYFGKDEKSTGQQEFSRMISFYYCLSVTGIPRPAAAMALALGQLFDWAEQGPPV